MRGSARGALGLPLPLPLLLAALVVAACVRRTQHLAPAAGVAALGTPELIQEIVREALVLDAAGDRAADTLYAPEALRSEEHTSELQSHSELVCRLLLEKKNTNYSTRRDSYDSSST